MMKIFTICIAFMCMVLPGVSMAGNLTDNGNGTVTDSGTTLMWQQGESSLMTWDAALTYCEGLTLAGSNDWRLPNIKELFSLVADTRVNPSINTTMFPNAISSHYWSSTTWVYIDVCAWGVYFDTGRTDTPLDKVNSSYARCVRGGQ